MINKNILIKNAVIPIIIANIAIFIAQIIIGEGFTRSFMLISEDVATRPWIIITSMFLHGSPSHLIWNMFALFMFGPILESRIGPKKFLIVYFISGILASIAGIFFYKGALGASGAIMGMLGALIIIMPNLKLLLFFAIPMPLWFAGILWVALDSFGILFPSNIGHIAHLTGIFIGLAFGLYWKKKSIKTKNNIGRKNHLTGNDLEEYIKNGRI